MSLCRFRFETTGPAREVVSRIREHVRRAGGRFERGAFHLPTPVGEFMGDYILEEAAIVIEVTEKPFFVPCSAIESRLVDYVRNAAG